MSRGPSPSEDKHARAAMEWLGIQGTQDYVHRDEMVKRLAELEADERLTKYRTASVFTNVVLALHQQAGRAQIDLLRKLLDMPPFIYPKGDPE